MKIIKIGIMSQKKIRERTLAIAQGKYKPKSDEAKIWFTSVRTLSEALCCNRLDEGTHIFCATDPTILD